MKSLQAVHRYLQATRVSASHAVQIEILNLAAVGFFHRNDRGFSKQGSDWALEIITHGLQVGVMMERVDADSVAAEIYSSGGESLKAKKLEYTDSVSGSLAQQLKGM